MSLLDLVKEKGVVKIINEYKQCMEYADKYDKCMHDINNMHYTITEEPRCVRSVAHIKDNIWFGKGYSSSIGLISFIISYDGKAHKKSEVKILS